MDTDSLLPPRWRDSPVLALRIEPVIVTALSEFRLEFLDSQAESDGFIDCLTRHIVPCRHAGFLHLVNILAYAFPSRVLHDGQSALLTDAVRCLSELPVGILAVVEFPAVLEGYRVDHDVVMNALCVDVCRNHHLEPVSP